MSKSVDIIGRQGPHCGRRSLKISNGRRQNSI
jgi:hypothetical protein